VINIVVIDEWSECLNMWLCLNVFVRFFFVVVVVEP